MRKKNSAKRRGKIAVWWDMEDCPIPEGYDARWVRPNIVRAFRKLGFSGRVSISAYGDLNQTPDHVLQGLTSTRVHVLHTVPDVKCERMLSDLMEWRRLNPPPATMMLISDQVSHVFYWALLRLQQQTPNYKLCLAYESSSPRTSMLPRFKEWSWKRLLRVNMKRFHERKWNRSGNGNYTGALLCTLCYCHAKSLEDFRNHLSSQEHALKESRITPSIPLSEYEQPLEACFGLQRMWGDNSPAEPEFATAKIAVWWYMDDCPIPDDFDPRSVCPTLQSAFENLGYTGPVSICAYGNLKEIPERVLQGLTSTGVNVLHTVTDVAYSRIFSDMSHWRRCNSPPATMMLISNRIDSLFSMPLASAQLRSKYNMFLACNVKPSKTSVLLTSAEWLWESLLKVPLTTRHLLGECSQPAGMFYCGLCFCEFKSTLRHLFSDKHNQEEDIINEAIQRRTRERLYWQRWEEMEKLSKEQEQTIASSS